MVAGKESAPRPSFLVGDAVWVSALQAFSQLGRAPAGCLRSAAAARSNAGRWKGSTDVLGQCWRTAISGGLVQETQTTATCGGVGLQGAGLRQHCS